MIRVLLCILYLLLATNAEALQGLSKEVTFSKHRNKNQPKTSLLDVVAQAKSSSKLSLSISPDSFFATSLRFAGPIMFTGMQISSVRTAYGIHKAKSTGDLSPLPFTSLVVNCIVWTLYGILKKDLTVLVPNANGILLGLIGTVVYQKYSKKLHTNLYAVGALVCAAAYKLFLNKNASKIGLIGCSLAVVLSGSPLATVGTVLKDKSTAALPFENSLSTWLNALCWFLYGTLVAHDIMIFGPNGMGLGLASIQMLMFVLYGLPPK